MCNSKRADSIIQKLKMQKHPEGGYYNEYYRASETIKCEALPDRYKSDHCFSTAIYYLLEGSEKSKQHIVQSDEIWLFHEGSPIKLNIINANGEENIFILGPDIENSQLFALVIEHGSAMSAEPLYNNSYSLVSCTVAPGFEFEDFEITE